jgi:hypothetical protein
MSWARVVAPALSELHTATGAKGSDVYTADAFEDFGEKLLALSVLLTRGANEQSIKELVYKLISISKGREDLENLVVLAFQTRDVRGGKGERDVSRYMFECLLECAVTKDMASSLLDLISEYGCWQDLFKLSQKMPSILPAVKAIVAQQFAKDEAAIKLYEVSTDEAEKKPSVSLLAKWLPREGQSGVIDMAITLVPGKMFHGTRMKLYRKRVAAVNKFLQTVEVLMCSNEWDKIEPGCVPGRAAKNYVKAFLNEYVSPMKKKKKAAAKLRHPDDPLRMECRKNFQVYNAKTATGEVKAKGADTVFPHEIIKKACGIAEAMKTEEYRGKWHKNGDTDDESDQSETAGEAERNHLIGVWNAMVSKAKEGGGLGRSLAMCDFSGSMRSSSNGDLPFWVSMALGLLISEVTTEEFKNTFLTFDSTPKLHVLPEGDIISKLMSFNSRRLSQGTSTDFQKAMDLVLARCKAAKVKPGEEPENLIVLTDMAWDAAYSSSEPSTYTGNSYRHVVKTSPWQTHVEMIREAFKRAGEDIWGEGNGWKMPTIVIWNISADCQDFHAKAETEGVVMLSGWSPSLFKVLQTKGVYQITPIEALRLQLEDKRYDLVRERFRKFFSSPA